MALQDPQNKSIILIIDQSNSTATLHPHSALPSQYQSKMQKAYAIGSGEGLYNYLSGTNSMPGYTDGLYYEISASLAYRLSNVYGEHPVIVNASIANTSLFNPPIGNGTWLPDVSGSLYNSQMAALFYPTLNRCKGLKDCFVMLGLNENDAMDSDAANAHYANKKALIAKLRGSIGSGGTGFTNCKIGIMRLKSDIDPISRPYASIVRAADEQIISEDANTVLLDCDPIPFNPDLVHYTNNGAVLAGNNWADVIAPYINY